MLSEPNMDVFQGHFPLIHPLILSLVTTCSNLWILGEIIVIVWTNLFDTWNEFKVAWSMSLIKDDSARKSSRISQTNTWCQSPENRSLASALQGQRVISWPARPPVTGGATTLCTQLISSEHSCSTSPDQPQNSSIHFQLVLGFSIWLILNLSSQRRKLSWLQNVRMSQYSSHWEVLVNFSH